MKTNNKNTSNYLENIPIKNPDIRVETNYKGDILLVKENNKFFDKVVQRLFGKSKYTKFKLDGYGKFIWNTIDGSKNLIDIGKEFKEKYKDKSEPLYERLSIYFKNLETLGFVLFIKD